LWKFVINEVSGGSTGMNTILKACYEGSSSVIGDGRNSAINELGGTIFVTATQIHTRVWRPKTLVLIRSQYPRQSNDEFQQHCHECQKHSRDVVFQTAVEETVVNDPRGGVIEEGIPIVMLGWASYVKIIGE
jgi:hypothetical protein